MKNNKKLQEEMIKNIAVIGAVSISVLLIMVSSILFLKSKIVDKNINQEEIIGEIEEDEGFESASTEIGKTVEEAQNEIESQTENNVSEKEENQITTTNKPEEKEENKIASTKKQEPKEEIKNEIENQENKQIKFVSPIKGEVIREFASDSLVFSETLQEWITHKGIDIKADKTSVVVSTCDGTVESIKNDPRFGLTVIIEHDGGYKTVYSNLLTAEFVVQGEKVTAGQTVGTVGNSASFEVGDPYHLHFELLKDGEYLDPAIFIEFT